MNAKLTRLFLGIAAAGAVAACMVNLSFTYPKSGVVVAITDQTSVNQAIPIDLSEQAEVKAHKANVQDLTLESLDAGGIRAWSRTRSRPRRPREALLRPEWRKS